MFDASSEWFDAGETIDPVHQALVRNRALAAVIEHAIQELPLYRHLWASHGFDRVDVADFERLPTLRKADLVETARTRRSAMVGIEALEGLTPSNIVMTSGTMGFHTFATLTAADLGGGGLLAQQRELWSMKVRPEMRVLSVSPAWHALGLFEVKALESIGAHPILPWGSLTPRFAGDLISAIAGLRPEHVLLTVRAIRMILQECTAVGLDPRTVFDSVRYLGCAGEPLSVPFRQHLCEQLGIEDVFERGGSGDGMFGGAECHAHRGHHISADVHHVEILSPVTGRPVDAGQRGVAVVTNLSRGRSVYIRFDTEDVASVIPGPCPCERTSPVIEFHGRLAESVRAGELLIATADMRFALDDLEATRFRPFSMQTLDSGVEVAVPGVREDLGALSEALSQSLGVEARLVPGEVVGAGWKSDRTERRAHSA